MTDTPTRIFLAIGALAVIWILTYWLYTPPPPRVTFGERPASMAALDTPAAPRPPEPRATPRPAPPPVQRAETPTPPTPQPPPPAAPQPQQPTPLPPRQPNTREYIVQKGDSTLAVIAQRELGDSRRWNEIASLNPYVDPRKLIPGRTMLLLPTADARPQPDVTPAAPRIDPQPPASPPSPPPAAADTTYTIVSGDTLSGIAKKVYGQTSLWTVIYDANRGVIDDPDRLPPLGTVLKIPPKP